MRINQDVTYDRPVFQRTKVGATPRDYFNQGPKPADTPPASLPQEIWVDQPVRMESVTRHIEEAPYSPVLRGLGMGTLGAFVGGFTGALAGLALAHPGAGLAVGATLLGGAGAYLGAKSAVGDQVSLQWEPQQVFSKTMTGYEEQVSPGTFQGREGFYHRFEPNFETQLFAEYQTPKVVHSK